MFVVIFCPLVILFLFISRFSLIILIPLGLFCDAYFTNKILRASGYAFSIIVGIGLVIYSIILAYKLTPEILGYIK